MKISSYRKLQAIKDPGLYRAGDTLYLLVKPTGGKSWVQRLVVNGKRRDIGLGSFKLVTLAEARDKAHENRRAARIFNVDPQADKRKARIPVFQIAADKTFQANKARWKCDKTVRNWHNSMARHVFPVIGDKRVDRIGREDVLIILTPIWTEVPQVARKLRQRLRTIFSWCQGHGYIEVNPAGECIDGALVKMPSVKKNHLALSHKDVPAALVTVEESTASMAAKLALRFLVLTAGRSGEIRGATWNEIDPETATWNIPADRMKAGKPHRVPLSGPALAVLEQARGLDDGSGLVFPSAAKPGRQLSVSGLLRVLGNNGLADRATVHGFRASFRSWCADAGKDRELAEAALAHVVGGVEGAYFRSDLIERRRKMMEQWADYVTASQSSKVVQLHA